MTPAVQIYMVVGPLEVHVYQFWKRQGDIMNYSVVSSEALANEGL
jgi:hypothetical protein